MEELIGNLFIPMHLFYVNIYIYIMILSVINIQKTEKCKIMVDLFSDCVYDEKKKR